jgi:hypothetical protein
MDRSDLASDVRLRRLWIGCCAALAIALVHPSAAEGAELTVKWVLGNLDGGHLVAVTQDAELEGGSQVRMLVIPKSECYVYVLRVSQEGRVQRLLPKDPAHPLTVNEKYLYPNEGWHVLGEGPGRETFHLLASAAPLATLEGLLAQSASTPSEANDSKVTEEIKRLHKEARLKSSEATSMGGRVRGGAVLEELQGNLATAESLLIRSYTIDYR